MAKPKPALSRSRTRPKENPHYQRSEEELVEDLKTCGITEDLLDSLTMRIKDYGNECYSIGVGSDDSFTMDGDDSREIRGFVIDTFCEHLKVETFRDEEGNLYF